MLAGTYPCGVTRRALVIAYHFPPLGGAGVQRTVKFAQHLPELGYEPVVLTGPGSGSLMPHDTSLETGLPPDLEVHRVAGPEPGSADGWRGRAERWLRLETAWNRWWRRELVETGQRIRSIDVVLATMSPFQSATPAAALARRLGVPWVADLRDPWALDEMQVYETGVHRRLDLRRMGADLGSAAAIVMNTPEAADAFASRFGHIDPSRVHVIPNGFDRADFEDQVESPDDGVFRIVHTGLLHTSLGLDHRRSAGVRRLLGGTLGDVDILPRSHIYLLQAVERVLADLPELRGRMRVQLAGALSDADRSAAAPEVVEQLGYLAHRDAVRLLRRGDLLFLPMHQVSPTYRTRIVPGKTYEYLASRRPILAAVPPGDARDLLEVSGNATVCDPDDVETMTRIVRDEARRVLAEGRRPDREVPGIERFERRALAARLAGVLDDVVGAPSTLLVADVGSPDALRA
jgi:glycosyltransferase involved in cell wall biosynthesis